MYTPKHVFKRTDFHPSQNPLFTRVSEDDRNFDRFGSLIFSLLGPDFHKNHDDDDVLLERVITPFEKPKSDLKTCWDYSRFNSIFWGGGRGLSEDC
jgi:hypothetical protein